MKVSSFYLLLILTFISFTKVDLADNPRHRLASSLFPNYKPFLRPYCGNDDPTNVTLDLSLRQLVDLDEPVQMLKVNLWIRMQWVDCQLVWNSSEYNGIDNIVVPYDQIWIPDLTLYDSVATETRGYTEFRPVIHSNGTVVFKFPMLVESECVVNVRYFPYDTQYCRLKYGSWAQNGLEIDFFPKNSHGDLDETVENTEWNILEFKAQRNVKYYNCCPEPFPDVTFVLKIKRKPLFYIINIIIPTFLITLMGILVFGLPVESGEKVSLEITVMLALAVFQLLVADSMPPSAATVPLIESRGYTDFHAVVFSNGSVIFKFPMLVESECIVDVKFFPFDIQYCPLKYGSWSHNGLELDLWPKNSYGDLNESQINTEWTIIDFPAERTLSFYRHISSEPFLDVTYTLKMKRKPLFFIINIIIPTFVVILMGMVVFGIPLDSGERLSVGITVLLSLLVFQLLVADSMPPSAATIPLIAIYFDFSLCLIGFACVMSVVSINLYCTENTRMSKTFRKVFLCCFAKLTLVHVPEEYKHEAYAKEQNNKEANNHSMEPCLHPEIKLHTKDESEFGSFTNLKSKERHKHIWSEEWKIASKVLDRLGCVIFIVLLSIVTLSIFIQYR